MKTATRSSSLPIHLRIENIFDKFYRITYFGWRLMQFTSTYPYKASQWLGWIKIRERVSSAAGSVRSKCTVVPNRAGWNTRGLYHGFTYDFCKPTVSAPVGWWSGSWAPRTDLSPLLKKSMVSHGINSLYDLYDLRGEIWHCRLINKHSNV